MTADVTVLVGTFIGFFFGMLVASTAAANERRRGVIDAERGLRQMARDVERDEQHARWRGLAANSLEDVGRDRR